MKKSIYRFLIINIIIFALIIINLSFYMIGIIEKSSVLKLVNDRFLTLEKSIDNSNEEIETILAQVSQDNIAKAKAFAIILNQSPKSYLDNEAIEEIRVALSADEILITDEKGIVIAGTSPYIGQDFHDSDINKQFLSAIEDRNFSKATNIQKNGAISQIAAVARLDKPGIIVLESTTKYFTQTVKLAGMSTVASGFTILKEGTFSILNSDSWGYVSHTNEEFIGKSFQIPKEKLINLETTGSGYFKNKFLGKSSYIFYKEYNENILIAVVPFSEVYIRRNYVFFSLIIALPILSLIMILSVRKKLIDINLE